MVSVVNAESQQVLKSLFKKYDKDDSGQIDSKEFHDLCYDLGYYMQPDETTNAIKLLDHDKNHSISFDEFFIWWKSNDKFAKLDQAKSKRMKQAVTMFRKYDTDKSGEINQKEWGGLVKELYGEQYSADQITAGFKQIDKDNSGNVSFNEFIKWLKWF